MYIMTKLSHLNDEIRSVSRVIDGIGCVETMLYS